MTKDGFQYDDGGRLAAGHRGKAGDCVCRAIAIASGRPYREVYDALSKGTGAQRRSKCTGKRTATAGNGINTKRKWFNDYMTSLGFEWVPTMGIGSGCTVHLRAEELPVGALVVSVSKHFTAMIDGVIHDTHDPRRSISYLIEPDKGQALKPNQGRNENGVWTEIGGRCVYGYYRFKGEPS